MKKSKPAARSPSGIYHRTPSDAVMKFSFRLFDNADQEMCPQTFCNGYVHKLMDRMKSLSTWYIRDFITKFDKSLRNHAIEWNLTSRPNGFVHLPEEFNSYTAYQFSLSANEYGRVHGLIIGDTFYVIWLDCNHQLYPR